MDAKCNKNLPLRGIKDWLDVIEYLNGGNRTLVYF